MKNRIIILTIIILTFVIILIPLKGSHAFYSDNKDLDIINTKVGNFSKTELEKYLRSNDENNNLSKYVVGDMYRYQGTDNVANWICFGTTENCGANDDLIDKYMYRIIGITPDGQLKLLKETFLKEGKVNGFVWNDEGTIYADANHPNACPNGICPDWNETDLFYRINGSANGKISGNGNANDGIDDDTDIFVDNGYYDYLKSGDLYNGTKDGIGSSWYQLIDGNHSWLYGDILDFYYNGDQMYAIESGKAETRYSEGTYGYVTYKYYKWTKKVQSRIGLLNISDYIYAYPGGNPETAENAKNSWIHFQNDGYNDSPLREWLMTRSGVPYQEADYCGVMCILGSSGKLSSYYNDGCNPESSNGVRPIFYLNSDVTIHSGNGTKTNPFIINI